jgi:hypothetical protein
VIVVLNLINGNKRPPVHSIAGTRLWMRFNIRLGFSNIFPTMIVEPPVPSIAPSDPPRR